MKQVRRNDPSDTGEAARWELTSWEGNRRWRAARALEATPLARLRWLESAIALAHAAGALPERKPTDLRRSDDGSGAPTG